MSDEGSEPHERPKRQRMFAEAMDEELAWQLQCEEDCHAGEQASAASSTAPPGSVVNSLFRSGQQCYHCSELLDELGRCTSCGTYRVRCPYDDCRRNYEVSARDVNCGVFRCGGCFHRGTFYPFPQHRNRQQVIDYVLQKSENEWWRGWPEHVEGCGRPFRFESDNPMFSMPNDGEKITWDDEPCGDRMPIEVDPQGNYEAINWARILRREA